MTKTIIILTNVFAEKTLILLTGLFRQKTSILFYVKLTQKLLPVVDFRLWKALLMNAAAFVLQTNFALIKTKIFYWLFL